MSLRFLLVLICKGEKECTHQDVVPAEGSITSSISFPEDGNGLFQFETVLDHVFQEKSKALRKHVYGNNILQSNIEDEISYVGVNI